MGSFPETHFLQVTGVNGYRSFFSSLGTLRSSVCELVHKSLLNFL